MEALCYKLPVIATNCSFGPEDIIENGINGRLVPVNDSHALKTAILDLLSHKHKRIDLSNNAMKNLPSFLIEKIGTDWIKLFNDII